MQPTILNMEEDLAKLQGCYIRIETADGPFTGICTGFNRDKQLILKNVIDELENQHLIGLQYFDSYDIENYEILKKEVSKPKEPKKQFKEGPIPNAEYLSKDPEEELKEYVAACGVKTVDTENASNNQPKIAEKKEFTRPPHLESSLPANYHFVYSYNSFFHRAIQNIKRESKIGVSLEGVCIGRTGEISYVNIATSTEVYLFDILTLQAYAFKNGLKEIFENKDIIKVFHDCRWASDALFYKFKVKLVGVYDTQVADATVYYQQNGKFPEYVPDLSTLLEKYFCLSVEDCPTTIEDPIPWKHRPLPFNLKIEAIKNVIYLRSLQKLTLNEMLKLYFSGVDLYLKQVRDANNEEIFNNLFTPDKLPNSFQSILVEGRRKFDPVKLRNSQNKAQDIENYLREDLMSKKLDVLMDLETKLPDKNPSDENLSSLSKESKEENKDELIPENKAEVKALEQVKTNGSCNSETQSCAKNPTPEIKTAEHVENDPKPDSPSKSNEIEQVKTTVHNQNGSCLNIKDQSSTSASSPQMETYNQVENNGKTVTNKSMPEMNVDNHVKTNGGLYSQSWSRAKASDHIKNYDGRNSRSHSSSEKMEPQVKATGPVRNNPTKESQMKNNNWDKNNGNPSRKTWSSNETTKDQVKSGNYARNGFRPGRFSGGVGAKNCSRNYSQHSSHSKTNSNKRPTNLQNGRCQEKQLPSGSNCNKEESENEDDDSTELSFSSLMKKAVGDDWVSTTPKKKMGNPG